jgi:hypothetical protein
VPDFKRKPVKVMAPKVFVIDFRPAAVPPEWNHADALASQYAQTMRTASANRLIYQIVKKTTVVNYPILEDGRRYTDVTWTQAMQNDKLAFRDSHGNYMMANYMSIVQEHSLLQQIRDKVIDEVWMFGGPYFGFYESRMVGRGAFWCNAPGIEQTGRRFVMMGFNYQRDVKEMVHDFGHRAESILSTKFGSQSFIHQLYGLQATPAPVNEFEQWLQVHGTVHRKPGGADYGQDELAWVTALKPDWFPPTVNPNLVG